MTSRRKRTSLSREASRRHYVQTGLALAIEQVRADALDLDRTFAAIGPFARLDANAAAAREGKTRGAVTNAFGSQAAFQAETMRFALQAEDLLPGGDTPLPADHAEAEDWVRAFFAAQSARGPRHGGDTGVSYAMAWTLWLATLPYGVWSERIAGPAVAEYAVWVAELGDVFGTAVDHFRLRFRDGADAVSLAAAAATLIEGCWLNQVLSTSDPANAGAPASAALVRSGLMLWRGAVRERTG
jgi:hypothetical protein